MVTNVNKKPLRKKRKPSLGKRPRNFLNSKTKPSRLKKNETGVQDKFEILETQSDRVFKKFGGARNLAKTLSLIGYTKNPSAVYRWSYPVERGGCDGLIPSHIWKYIFEAARAEGLHFTSEELDPRPRMMQVTKYIDEKDAENIFDEMFPSIDLNKAIKGE